MYTKEKNHRKRVHYVMFPDPYLRRKKSRAACGINKIGGKIALRQKAKTGMMRFYFRNVGV